MLAGNIAREARTWALLRIRREHSHHIANLVLPEATKQAGKNGFEKDGLKPAKPQERKPLATESQRWSRAATQVQLLIIRAKVPPVN